ncbi:hypothetical protein J1N35_011107 [Gossypium stocksii]|uniref:Uncharacterized protein n=1 Tax=Gossypium stocksii TaxID=47602 RepID=A0A9D4ACZ8_9ROSI|nr:hypothetical protein J1N35_011107 [Gossypium stocksii]
MVRMIRAGSRIIPVPRSSPILATEKSYACTTKQEEIEWVLSMPRIKLSNFAYELSLPKGSHRLCETIEDSFLLPLHALEARFIYRRTLFFEAF